MSHMCALFAVGYNYKLVDRLAKVSTSNQSESKHKASRNFAPPIALLSVSNPIASELAWVATWCTHSLHPCIQIKTYTYSPWLGEKLPLHAEMWSIHSSFIVRSSTSCLRRLSVMVEPSPFVWNMLVVPSGRWISSFPPRVKWPTINGWASCNMCPWK